MTEPREQRKTCGESGGTTQAGAPCRAFLNLNAESGLCLVHDDERIDARQAMRLAGAVANTRAARARRSAEGREGVPSAPQTIEDAERFASWLTHAVCAGEIDARSAHEAAVCLREFRGASEKRIIERELRELRAELAAARAEAPGRTRRRGVIHE